MFPRPMRLDPLDIVTREDWGGVKPRWETPITKHPVHHYVIEFVARRPCYDTETPDLSATMRKLQKNHMADKNCPDIKYNFVVGYDGRVYEGRGWLVEPTLPDKYDKIKHLNIYVGWIGKFESSKSPMEIRPPQKIFDVRRTLLNYGQQKKYLHHVLRIFVIKRNYKRKGDFSTDWE